MLTEFVGLQLSRNELQEIYAALLKQAVIEDEVRRERGLEEVEKRPLLERLEMLLGMDEMTSHALDHVAEDELWEYAWYTFTDEWAWYRAQQDLQSQLDAKSLSEEDMRKQIESMYRKHFDKYVAEVTMKDEDKPRKSKTPQL